MTTLGRTRNKLLAQLSQPELARVLLIAERLSPPLGDLVAHAGVSPRWVHFPVTAVLSSTVVLEDGSTVEGASVGCEGIDGLHVLGGTLPNPHEVRVQVQGELLRIPAGAFGELIARLAPLRQLLVRYALASIQRGAQNAACIQHHTVAERTCRWLLETADRHGADRFHVTQEFLSEMLGVRRQSVNHTARLLQSANLIRYHRGELAVLDRAGLEDASCECFRVTNEMYAQAMRAPEGPHNPAASHTAAQATALSRF
jgi:CRP-like cAMP-binding protein